MPADEGMDAAGLEMLALCVQSNVDQATHMHDVIVAGKDQEIERLRFRLDEALDRESKMHDRMKWLMGYDPDVTITLWAPTPD